MAIKDWNGFKKSGDTYIPKDATARAGLQASVSLLDDTVGWIGGNEIDSSKGTGDSIFTLNSNKTVTANGTGGSSNSQFTIPINVSGDFYFLGCPEGGAVNKYDIYIYDITTGARVKKWDGVTQSESNYGNAPTECKIPEGHEVIMQLRVFANFSVSNIVFKPMLLTKEQYALNPSYRPFHESVEEQLNSKVDWDSYTKTGVHNLFPIKLSDVKSINTGGSWDGNAYTKNGVTFTFTVKNGYVTQIDISGAATDYTWVQLIDNLWDILEDNTDYILTGCPSGGGSGKYALQPRITIGTSNTALENSNRQFLTDYGNGTTFNLNSLYSNVTHERVTKASGNIWIGMRVDNGASVSNITFKPMIRLATDSDDTYALYAMTNRELTEKALIYKGTIANNTDFNNFSDDGQEGIYNCEGATGLTNIPSDFNGYGKFIFLKYGGQRMHIIVANGAIYTRVYAGSAWRNWFKFAGTEMV